MTDLAAPSRSEKATQPTTRSSTLGAVSVVVVTALCFAIAGCGSESNSNNSDAARSETSIAAPADSPGATSIDACSLLSAEDISALLGTVVEGKSTSSSPDLAGCIWENPENYESISVEIGNPGTAVDNTLPPPEPGFPEIGSPGPDGMRFLGNGQVEFPAGGRSNTVQVAVLSMSGDEANNAAVELARKIAPQIPE